MMLTDDDFRTLLDHYNRPWQGYRKVRKGVMKRLRRHMTSLHCKSLPEYIDTLERSSTEQETLQSHLRVTISRFNRDRHLWDDLGDHVIPRLLQQTDKINIWSAGCSCGEEVYSLKILWERYFSSYPPVSILATDADSKCLERAQAGTFQKSSLREFSEKTISRCFDRSSNRAEYTILPQFKNNIAWRRHNFFAPPPAGIFHIVFLRNNLLTYYNEPLQSTALSNILSSLSPDGYLVIGSHETLPKLSYPFTCLERYNMIYQLKIIEKK